MADTSYFAQTTFEATAAQTAFAIGFPARKTAHIKLAIDGVDSTDFNVTGDLTAGSGTLNYTGTALSGGETVRIYRRSPETFATLAFQASGADPLTADDLDELVKGLLYLVQETKDRRRPQWVNKSAVFTVDPDAAQAFAVDVTAGDVTANLPLAADWRGELLYFKVEAGANDILIDGSTTELVDGGLILTVTGSDAFAVISSDGDEWFVVAAS